MQTSIFILIFILMKWIYFFRDTNYENSHKKKKVTVIALYLLK